MPTTSEPFYIVGHRGAAGEKLENSLDGFHHTLTLAIDAIELDIREHLDELWVFHDRDLRRMTTSTGGFEDHADPASVRLNNGEVVPTLQQVLDLYWGKMPVNIEIKSVANPRLLLDLLARYPAPEARTGHPWILISSFNHNILLQLRELGCTWPLAPISGGIPIQFTVELEQLSPWSWHFDDEYLDLELVQQLRDQGVPSLVFTVNDAERAAFLKRRGVAGIFTDFPSQMLELLAP
ncbi:MAG: glycerophosphodiester phosphodiesterase [Gammaproteobacteria bacterium]|nr:glycerophosphodiester phosphodiesterase [Gammaproteobacteria bacterium]